MRRGHVGNTSHIEREEERERERENASEWHEKPQHVVSYLTAASSLRFQQGKAERENARDAAGKERIEKGGRWKRATTVWWLQRGGEVGVKKKDRRDYMRCWRLAATERAWPRKTRAREEKKRKENAARSPSTDSFARSASLHNAPRLHPMRVTAVSLSLSFLSICFFFSCCDCSSDVSRIRIEHLSCNVIGILLDSVLVLCSYNDANEKYFI